MSKYLFILACLIFFLLFSCKDSNIKNDDTNHRQEMKNFVQGISEYAKGYSGNFIIIPQNGHELLTQSGEDDGESDDDYINAIDGIGREDLYYGYDNDNIITPPIERDYMLSYMDVAEANNVQVLTTDYCWTHAYMDSSYKWNNLKGYISLAADHRELDNIPSYPENPYNANVHNISSLTETKNFLYLLNTELFDSKQEFIDSLKQTNYDLIILDLYFNDTTQFTASDISVLKMKGNGGSRLIISYMSIGEAENYRYYWQNSWNSNPPHWLDEENPDWEGNFKVQYWEKDWQDIIYGNDDSYLKEIIDAGFDGVYLDIIDAYEYFE